MSLYQGAHSSPLAGYGFGIGMVEIYTKYFGGSINILSEEGNGTSIALSFPSDSSLAVENFRIQATSDLSYVFKIFSFPSKVSKETT